MDNNPVNVWPFCYKLCKNCEVANALPASVFSAHALRCAIFVFMQRYPDTTENGVVRVFLLHVAVETLKLQPFQGEGSKVWSRCVYKTHRSKLKSQTNLIIMKIQFEGHI